MHNLDINKYLVAKNLLTNITKTNKYLIVAKFVCALVSSDVDQYADGTLMFFYSSNLPMLAKKLQDDTDSVVCWLVSNKSCI